MKYLYFLFVVFLLIYGCSSSQGDEKRNRDLQNMKRNVDSLKIVKNNLDKSLDSLNSANRKMDEELNMMKMQLDSLNRNIQENK